MELFVHIISQSVVNSMFTRNSVTRRESIKIVEKKTTSTVQITNTELKTDKTQLPPQIQGGDIIDFSTLYAIFPNL